jgi:hypothetical protein
VHCYSDLFVSHGWSISWQTSHARSWKDLISLSLHPLLPSTPN